MIFGDRGPKFQPITPPMGGRSSGGINFGEVQLSQFKVASTSGLCLRKPRHAAEILTTASRPITPGTAPHRNTAVRNVPG